MRDLGIKERLFLLLLLLGLSAQAWADFDAGLRAYSAGDYATAVREWRAAAKRGDANAQFRLGQLYEQGRGLLQNYVSAHLWYNLAAAQGHQDATAARGALTARMTPAQVAEAQKLAAAWTPRSTATPPPAPSSSPATGDTPPLVSAVHAGDIAKVTALLAAGADANVTLPDGTAALLMAVSQNHPAIAEALLAAGARPDPTTATGWTALMLAIFNGQPDMARLLIARGANIAARAADGTTPRDLAEQTGQSDLLPLLTTPPQAQQAPAPDRTLVAEAQRLLSALGLNPGPADGIAGRKTQGAIRSYQERAGLPADAQVSEGLVARLRAAVKVQKATRPSPQALFNAAEAGDTRAVRALVGRGLEVNSKDADGWTALLLASAGGHVRTVQALLAAGADVNVMSRNGATPLMVATLKGDEATVRALLEAGADVTAKNAKDITALTIAEQKGFESLLELLVPKTLRNSIGMEFMRIPEGSFQMGSSDRGADSDERPVHWVRISRSFYLGKYEVTQAEWEAVMGSNPSRFKGRKRPVENVSWEDVQAFIQRLNAREGHTQYRLPTEAEWEYAARAGTRTAYSFGDDARQLDAYAWYRANAGDGTHAAGQKMPNAWGLYDMHGNVREWVQDWYGGYPAGSAIDPQGPPRGSHRVFRGGSWYLDAGVCRSAYRSRGAPDDRYGYLGFRLLRTSP